MASDEQSGGGKPSGKVASETIESFSPVVLSHLKHIYTSLCNNGEMGKTQSDAFLRDIQCVPTNGAQSLDKPKNDLGDFVKYMASPESNAMDTEPPTDLSYPISNYFISTSHNTYLTRNQLYGASSADSYKNVLRRGCRSLEIDVWDGEDVEDAGRQTRRSWVKGKVTSSLGKIRHGDRPRSHSLSGSQEDAAKEDSRHSHDRTTTVADGGKKVEPRVLHGHTLTKEVSFRDVCSAIRDSAFIISDLPVVVSLEVHASLDQQQIMVDIMQEAWSGLLVDISQNHEVDVLPSPEQLKKKVLIKVKWTSPDKESSNNPVEHAEAGASSSEDERLPDEEKQKKSVKILQALSQLGVYTRAYSFKHFDQPESKIPTHVFSLSERKVKEVHESQGSALLDHNRDFLMRVFPSGMRVNSSNVEPTFLWRQGVQMVALNWQSCDEGMMLNEAMFAGQHGWVLKPPGYLGTRGKASQMSQSIRRRTLELKIELLAAQTLPLPGGEREPTKLHPYVKVELHADVPVTISRREDLYSKGDLFKKRSRTSLGVDAEFSGETLEFSPTSNILEELSFVRFKILDDHLGKDDLIAWACIRLDRLLCGYRFIHLFDVRGYECGSVLLVRITKAQS